MGFTEILTIVFVVLKLLNVISWNWFLVLLPEIIAAAFYLIIFIYSIRAYNKTAKDVERFFDKWRKEEINASISQ